MTNRSLLTMREPVIEGTGDFCSRAPLIAIKQFYTKHHVPAAGRTLRQAIERIQGLRALRAERRRVLEEWLAE